MSVRIVFIFDVPPAPLEMHVRRLVHLPHRGGLALWARGYRVIRVVLEELEFGITAVAEVSVKGNPITPS